MNARSEPGYNEVNMRRIPQVSSPSLLAMVSSILVTASLPAQSVTIAVGTVEAPTGGEAKVPVYFREAQGVGSFQFELWFDKAVARLVDVRLGRDFDNGMVSHDFAPDSSRVIVAGVTPGALEGDLEALEARFAVLGEEGASMTLDVMNPMAWEGEEDLEMLVSTEPGMLTVSGALFPWRYLLAGVAALLILGLLLAWRRRKRRKEPALAAATASGAAAGGPGTNFCSSCGSPLGAGATFCGACGRPVAG